MLTFNLQLYCRSLHLASASARPSRWARESSRSILLTDDFQARRAAESLGVQVVPTIRVLSTASVASLVDFNAALDRLQRTNFRVKQKLIDQIKNLLPPQ